MAVHQLPYESPANRRERDGGDASHVRKGVTWNVGTAAVSMTLALLSVLLGLDSWFAFLLVAGSILVSLSHALFVGPYWTMEVLWFAPTIQRIAIIVASWLGGVGVSWLVLRMCVGALSLNWCC